MDDRGRIAQPVTPPQMVHQSGPAPLQVPEIRKPHPDIVRRRPGDGPQRLGRWASIGLVCASFAYGLVQGGHLSEPDDASGRTAVIAPRAALAVADIIVEGSRHLDAKKVLAALGITRTTSMLEFNAAEARLRLKKLDWVAEAEVLKLYPDRVLVKLVERVPYARWQIGGKVAVIDSSGVVLDGLKLAQFAHLPLVVGKGAGQEVRAAHEMLARHAVLSGRIHALSRVAERRWNLRFLSGLVVMLPERDAARALAEFVKLDKKFDFSSRNIAMVDFRLPDRITLRPAEPEEPLAVSALDKLVHRKTIR